MSHEHSTWAGLSFEILCFNHIEQIKQVLSIGGVRTETQSWFGKGEMRNAQIDMLINRADDCVNLCEMKYYADAFAMTQADEDNIRRKVCVFQEQTGTQKHIMVTMITAHGLVHNCHSGIIQSELTLDDMFRY